MGNNELTSKVVNCIQTVIIQAVLTLLAALSSFMTKTVATALILALIAFAMRIMTGTEEVKSRSIAFFVRVGVVLMFSYNLGGFAVAIFNVEGELMTLVSGGISPWLQMDYFLGMLIGFAPGLILAQGLLGIIAAALFSTSLGVAVFMSGLMAILEVILFMFDCVYVYLQAIFAIGYNIILSTLVVPLGFFFSTEKYVTKWLNSLIAGMLVPVLLFAFLAMFLNLLATFIVNIFVTLGVDCGNPPALGGCVINFNRLWNNNIPLFTWANVNDPNFNNALLHIADGRITVPFEPAFLNPFLRLGANINPATVPRIDFSSFDNNWTRLSQLIFNFISLWFFASLLKSLAMKMPQVAESIASSVSGVSFQPSPLTQLVKGENRYQTSGLESWNRSPAGGGAPPGGGGGGE